MVPQNGGCGKPNPEPADLVEQERERSLPLTETLEGPERGIVFG